MFLFAALIGGLAFLVACVVLEDRRKPEIALLVVIGATMVDALIFRHQGSVPYGPFRPALGGQDFRIVDLVVPVALVARLLVRGLPRRVTGEGLIWAMFFGWYAYAAVVGIVRDQPTDLLLFQSKLLVQTGGVIALTAGVPLARLADPRLIDRLAVVGGLVAGTVIPLAQLGVTIDLPVLAGAGYGNMSPDAATMFFTLGALVLVAGVCRETLNPVTLMGGAAMIAAPFVAEQRAALAGMIPVVIVVALAMGGRTWRHRSPVRVAGLVPVAAVILLPIGIAAALAATEGEGITAVPIVDQLSETFTGEQKQASAAIRVDLLRSAGQLAVRDPVIGRGLGQGVEILPDTTAEELRVIGDFHNIFVDTTVRTGFSGLALFVGALATTFVAGRRRWRTLLRDHQAALVLGATAALSGLVVKGLFETVFQKYRLAVFLGLLIGIVASAAAAPLRTRTSEAARLAEAQWT